jgi:hypothetical protein
VDLLPVVFELLWAEAWLAGDVEDDGVNHCCLRARLERKDHRSLFLAFFFISLRRRKSRRCRERCVL